jgi:8-oxo-dGTP diphosphatase
MKQIAQVLLFDRDARLLIYLRDDNPQIPFPNHWDFFGGHLEQGETPEQALVREVEEEIGIELKAWSLFRLYHCSQGDVYPNLKHIFWARIDRTAEELSLREGQRLIGIERDETNRIRFANILGQILEDFIESGLWPKTAN